MLGVPVLAKIAGLSIEEYLANPLTGTLRANHALQVDGMVQPVIPSRLDEIRTGLVQQEKFAGIEPEALVAAANGMPDSEKEILSTFDFAAEERRYRDYFERAFREWGGIEPVPNFWEIGGHFPLYTEFGYIAFLMACALYPEEVGKIYWVKSVRSRERAKILLKLYREYDLVPLMFCGEDVCNNKGPMVSPAFLRKHYFPTVRMIIEPLVDAGVRRRGSSPKLQVLNTALMTATSGVTPEAALADREFRGRLVESAVGAHLANAAAAGECELFYWRDGSREVDFIVRRGREITAIEVKSGRVPAGPPGLLSFEQSFRPRGTLVVGDAHVPVEEFLSRPVAHWLM